MSVKSWPQRIFELSLGALAVGFILNWAWDLLRPLVPVVASVASMVVLAGLMTNYTRRKQGRW